RLDTVHASVFDKTVAEKAGKEAFLVIDFSSCHYLSSSGIRVLLRTSRELGSKGGKLLLTGLSPDLLQIFQIAGLDPVFSIFRGVQEAVNHIALLDKKFIYRKFVVNKTACEAEIITDNSANDLCLWNEPVLTGYDALQIATGWGAIGETLFKKDATQGRFFTLYHCTGLVPDGAGNAPDFRKVSDPSQGSVFVDSAYSVKGRPRVRITVNSPDSIILGDLLQACQFPGDINAPLCAAVCLDRDPEKPSLSVLFLEDGPCWHGGSFLLHHMTQKQPGETMEQYVRNLLSWENVEGVRKADGKTSVTKPVCWLFFADSRTEASGFLTQVLSQEESLSREMVYLTRRLYTDSRRVELQRLHGGYSASTFRVRSYDHQGRILRPTVLKTGDRAMIQREAERCKQYAMPYILNNSAMILGTAYYCGIGALRYNFVGIGGEGAGLKWLTHYFNQWPVRELEPLFDKIFLRILKPWYGQPVRELIYPYADHDPTMTFFPDLVERAGETLGIPADRHTFQLSMSDRQFMNPYRFLKEEYPKRRTHPVEYYTSVCHGDLNMQNILLDNEMNVYLIDFSETRPRSVISDFARMEAIFMTESYPMENRDDFLQVLDLVIGFYEGPCSLDKKFPTTFSGRFPELMQRNMALTMKMREYALASAGDDPTFMPYALALLEWVLPIVSYRSASVWQKRLSACIASFLCQGLA
ncbi:MAG: STAS domain-containing protein, partial [Ruminiclostridium sp.]|nr:STAS domain-containing protein [Ruminiclostridium sp.]